MRHRPTFEEFTELARGSTVVPVYRQLIGDTLTPVSAFCKIQEGEWSFLFESVVGGERLGRVQFSRLRPVPALPGVWRAGSDRHSAPWRARLLGQSGAGPP